MEVSTTNEDYDDEFFGNDSTETDFMATQESKAAERNLQNTAYLDAFDEHKEDRLQEGFESGYREVHELARQLGEQLGRMVARGKIVQDQDGAQLQSQIATGRFRLVLSEINKGTVPNEMAKKKLLELKEEMDQKAEN
jgi:flagellar biosynthesis/type III secretory pathway protein FliH